MDAGSRRAGVCLYTNIQVTWILFGGMSEIGFVERQHCNYTYNLEFYNSIKVLIKHLLSSNNDNL